MMDNPSRSERSRKLAIEAAFTIIARDGPGQLTFDAIARESGISKGGLMHQFRTKGNVLKALLEHQTEYFENFSRDYLATIGDTKPEATLLAQIATARESTTQQHSVALAILAALVEDPELLSTVREGDAKRVKRIKAEAVDPDLALLRWSAARGLALTALFGLCPFSDKERGRLFDRLLDEDQWPSSPDAKVKKPRSTRSSRSASHSDQSA
ncbi:TetR/AcrR family transcriptional regulator [Caballeronia sp. SEWSISQ10-4 2]|uniref:TetR/AcrR family transcriptional regulator n=1 Tax=Caballeronia sp. SEWSISQ10-4 2 TaxID=2937438 RepID=UPI00264D0425|nr:TetR/AcrR family transcriptional regulator [Caballeronia sp. SEWSISQ10-4 2]MDN7181010.1 TetR/AcrR family transcriptional regulator [Caballeronia sp. SEWSISQ10-4 2]